MLIVEDERKVATALQEGLEGEGYEAVIEPTAEGAFFRVSTDGFDLMLLDLGLPGRSGLEVLTALRRQNCRMPIIVVTARDTIDDRVTGLDSGADDYLVKPFAFAELLARVRSLLRRQRPMELTRIVAGTLAMDLIARTVTRDGQTVELTAREFELLEHLIRAEGQVVSRESIAHDVWKETSRSGTLDNVIDVHIARLRRKLDGPARPPVIHTVRGVGFLLREGHPDDSSGR